MLIRHQFYVYYEGARVFARRGEEAPVLVETCATPQDAYERVQSIVNPTGAQPSAFGDEGFNSEAFQSAISGNCEAAVMAAYSAGGAS